jgi:hypothetical protein
LNGELKVDDIAPEELLGSSCVNVGSVCDWVELCFVLLFIVKNNALDTTLFGMVLHGSSKSPSPNTPTSSILHGPSVRVESTPFFNSEFVCGGFKW